MMKERSDALPVDEKLEKQIEAFFDGELDGHERASLERRIAENDEVVLSALTSLKDLRIELRNWTSSQYLDSAGRRKIDVWSKIAPDIEQIAAGYREVSQRPSIFGDVSMALRRFLTAFNHPLPAFGFAAAAVAAVVLALPHERHVSPADPNNRRQSTCSRRLQ